ncbi:MAG: hypothetical protein HUJ58_07575 [Erysipelotrichaceae bacterium]|nr:hypothetical protein [Erysipelotrichaceae bacterium]
MNEVKSRVVRLSNIEEHKILAKISVKPYMSLLTLLAVSGFLIFRVETRLYGIGIVIGCLILLFAVPDRTILEAADRYILIYDEKTKDSVTQIFLSEIVNWEYVFNRKTEEVIFTLNDTTVISVPLVMTRTFMRYLRDKMESREIKRKK